ncbi:hypothetical protein, conserved in T. vivax [Trypanosoma vivax Y486]|uniref:Uncharacterized protein n=1 Tax=Trypanosoma vivax (strain Y486) TaxID=1055687 RepID=F9WKB7_TRYVY|nr:hypothetical protein, conserved in T. vivax [Trypanosoma vivax Y486]|eukprot:CCD17937.1 hypothetical protein, conserved in T. vivax [Trypanosoma vivax Y486]
MCKTACVAVSLAVALFGSVILSPSAVYASFSACSTEPLSVLRLSIASVRSVEMSTRRVCADTFSTSTAWPLVASMATRIPFVSTLVDVESTSKRPPSMPEAAFCVATYIFSLSVAADVKSKQPFVCAFVVMLFLAPTLFAPLMAFARPCASNANAKFFALSADVLSVTFCVAQCPGPCVFPAAVPSASFMNFAMSPPAAAASAVAAKMQALAVAPLLLCVKSCLTSP